MDLFDLVAKITLDSSGYERGLQDAESKTSGFGSKIGSAMKTGAVAVAAVTTAVVGLTTALVGAIGKTAQYGDTIDKQSQKMGLSATAYQEWDAILQHSGTSIDAMQRGMVTLSRQAENNAESFQRLGITQEELATLNQEELFARTIEGLQNMEAGTERTALAQELLGGSSKELGALLNTSAEDTEAMRQRVHELGGVMSDDAVKAAAAYQDSLQDMQTAISGASRTITGSFMPSVTLIMGGLTEIFSGGDGLGKITEGVNQFIQKLNAAIPRVVQTGGQILQQLAQAIIQNLPTLVESSVPVITSLAEGLIENLPMVADAAIQIILALANGLSNSIPQLVPVIVDVVLQIVNSLIQNAPLLLSASLQIMIALAQGLIAAVPQIVSKAPEIVTSLVNAVIAAAPMLVSAAGELISTLAGGLASFVGNLLSNGWEMVTTIASGIGEKFSDLVTKGGEIISAVAEGVTGAIDDALQWGKDLIQNFVDGIKAAWDGLKNVVSSVASSIGDVLGFSEPKIGPLSDFHTYAPDMMMLFAKGIKDNKQMLLDTVTDAFDFRDLIVDPNVGVTMTANAVGVNENGITGGTAIYGDINITVEGAGRDAEEIGEDLYNILLRQGVTAYAY